MNNEKMYYNPKKEDFVYMKTLKIAICPHKFKTVNKCINLCNNLVY